MFYERYKGKDRMSKCFLQSAKMLLTFKKKTFKNAITQIQGRRKEES